MTGFLSKAFKFAQNPFHIIPKGIENVIQQAAPAVLTLAGQPELAAGYSGLNSYAHGNSLGRSLGSAGTTYLGSQIAQGLNGGDSIFNGSQVGDAFGKIGNATGLSDVFNNASGALGDAKNTIGNNISNLYQGSGLQNAFNSGSDALKSFGLNPGSTTTSSAPLGGGSSSYGSSNNVGTFLQGNNSSTALNSINPSLGGTVTPSSSKYLSPLLSAGLGTYSNNSAQNALLKQANANKALLAPYQNFQFNPGDLTQDPGYKFNVAQGDQALARRQNANGNYFSGAAGKELQDYGQGLADNTYNSAFNRALQTNQTGYNNALGLAGINDSIGNIKATGTINNGNLYSGALGNVLGGNSFTNSGALQGGTDIQSLLRRLGYAA